MDDTIIYTDGSLEYFRDKARRLESENAALREALAIEKERSLYWRSIAGRKEAQP